MPVRGSETPATNCKYQGKSSSVGALLLLSEFKRFGVKAANRDTFCAKHPHVLLPPESSVGEIFNILLASYQ